MSRSAQLISIAFLLFWAPLAGFASETEGRSAYTIAVTGDWMPTRRLSVFDEPAYLDVISLLRGTDVALGNAETLFHDYESFPMHESGGIYTRSDPALVEDLVWAGLDMVSLANNHTGDYGVEGMRLTMQYLDAAGIVHAGVGSSLREAREARFLDTPRARIALISIASTYPDHSRASQSRGDMPSRPGLNPLRIDGWFGVTQAQMDQIAAALSAAGVPVAVENNELTFGLKFRVSDDLGVRSVPSESDMKRMGRIVRSARQLSDYVILSIHAHQTGQELNIPAEFIEIFARRMIDEGVDIVFGHGPHVLRGIEIHKGKPIFYSLGNFVFQMDGTLRVPPDNYAYYGLGGRSEMADYMAAKYEVEGYERLPAFWRSVLPVMHWTGKTLNHVELHPISLWHGDRSIDRGRPMLVDEDLGREIIGQLAELSRVYGTEIEWSDSVGVIHVAPEASTP